MTATVAISRKASTMTFRSDPIDHELMMEVNDLCEKLGLKLCELSDRISEEQEVILDELLPYYTSILINLGMILDVQRLTGVLNSFMVASEPRTEN